MAPSTRNEFREYCLRALGKGVLQINVTDQQVEDRIDEALKYYGDFHYDATNKVYYAHQVTEDDKINRYVTVPENIIGVYKMFPPFGMSMGSIHDPFSFQYQLAMTDLLSVSGTSIVPYYTARTQVALIEEILIGQKPIRFSRHQDRIYCDIDWKSMLAGSYIVFEAMERLDPDQYSDIWADRWLARYTEALIKRQWGNNMKKYTGIALLGGIVMNGQQIFQEADEEIKALEDEMNWTWSNPPEMLVG